LSTVDGCWYLRVLVAIATMDRLLTHTPQMHGLPVLVVSGIAALVMAVGALVLVGTGTTVRPR
jgi:hypothetical protein